MTTITWTISQLDCKPQEAGMADVVITAHWQCTGVDGEETASVYSTASFAQPGEPFTPYEQLTQEQVLGWIWAGSVDKAATEATVQQMINDRKNPPIVQPPLPWKTA